MSAIPEQQLGGVAQRGLEVLMELTAKLDAAESRESVAMDAARALYRATGCRRVVVVEPESDTELVVLASANENPPELSRSLIDQASRHGLVQLMVEAGHANQAQSIMDLGIRSAICAPILVDGLPVAFIVIDTRDTEGVVPPDAASFCKSVATLVGLSFQRINAALMAERHRQLQSDLDAARRAQEYLSPPNEGRFGAVAYRFESIPGRVVAGDLFDIFALDANRTAFFLGDVSGKGVGAAMLMAACQSQLRTQLLSGAELSTAMAAVNSDLYQRTESSKFVTLIAGVIDSAANTASLADAGHGFILSLQQSGPMQITPEPGFPLGVVDVSEFQTRTIPLSAGDGLLLFSDGAIEQPNPEGEQFGIERVLQAVRSIESPMDAVTALNDAVNKFASKPLADDLTVASLWIE